MPAAQRHALRIARDGLDAYTVFEFIRDGKTLPFSKAMAEASSPARSRRTVRGEGPADAYQGCLYFLGLQDRGRLEGLPLEQQLAK